MRGGSFSNECVIVALAAGSNRIVDFDDTFLGDKNTARFQGLMFDRMFLQMT
jgi:hypothetical protein